MKESTKKIITDHNLDPTKYISQMMKPRIRDIWWLDQVCVHYHWLPGIEDEGETKVMLRFLARRVEGESRNGRAGIAGTVSLFVEGEVEWSR